MFMTTDRTHTYEQATGLMLDATGSTIGCGYSGSPEGMDNPDMQSVPNVGPIPRGLYQIEAPHDSAHVGPFAMCLTPIGEQEMFGRADFLIHGDSKEHPGEASHGCIILPRTVREKIWASGDHTLQVTHG